ncbi:MAG TPA: electron transfer flavoprotein subunit alpha/FixB family protein [Acidimicrobiia bacterium]|nr:electron transfer flavoprotein subunit alpha/FixB family protein [Acidimicrobiia bacterium]
MILVLVTHDGSAVEETVFQALTFARDLASGLDTDLHAAWVGETPDVERLGLYGIASLHHISHGDLDDYAPQAWGEALSQLVTGLSPEAVVAIGSDRGNEVMAHVGAILGEPMVANVREVTPGDGAWEITRTRWGGSLLEETTLEAGVKLMTLTEHAIEAAAAATPIEASMVPFSPDLDDADLVAKVVDRVTTSGGITLATAPVVVSGGRGVGSPEGFEPLEDLAALLGGVVGCSRVVTNNGWRPHSDQVGQTGTVVAPDLYIACGISGAIQHWVGMMASKTILAINTDAEAPMVTKADYAVLGDLKDVVPAIVAEIEKRRGGD